MKNLTENNPGKREPALAKVSNIVLFSFFFGPVSAAMLIARNLTLLGNKKGARKAVITSCVYLALIMILSTVVGDNLDFENMIFYLVILAVNIVGPWLYVESTHGKLLEEHFERGGAGISWKSGVLCVLAGVAVTVAICALLWALHYCLEELSWRFSRNSYYDDFDLF